MAEIITFRPTPEVQEILSKVKEEGSSVGKYINNSIVAASSGSAGEYSTRISFYHAQSEDETPFPYGADTDLQAIASSSVPVGQLPAKRYSEFKEALKGCGMEYFYFRLNPDHVVGIISTSREEASIEFSKYFIQDPETKEYARTMLPLPQIRYDSRLKAAIVITKEPEL
jgi:hypothetical protein